MDVNALPDFQLLGGASEILIGLTIFTALVLVLIINVTDMD